MDKAAKYHNWVALPLRTVTVDGLPFSVPWYLHLDLGRQTQRSCKYNICVFVHYTPQCLGGKEG